MEIFKKLVLLAVAALGFVACANEVDHHIVSPSENIEEVGFSMPMDVTRTSINADGVTTQWSVGDRLAVWAKDAEGNYTFENAQFTLRYFSTEYDLAYFTSNINVMEDGEYYYYLSYPMPKSTNGTEATYSLPKVQSGKYEGAYDIMVAEPVYAEALTSSEKMVLNTVMHHQMHALKITVPEGRNHHGGRLYRLEITFPNAVVGDIVIDVSNPDAEPTYVNTSNTIVLECPEGFDVGDSLWAFVLPGTVDGDVSYIAKGEYRSTCAVSYPLNRDMRAGHVTPMNITIPAELNPYYTSVTFSVDQNNLGEDFNFFDVYDANGNHMGKFTRNAENKYVVGYEGEFDVDQYDNTSWRIVFDSEHAIVETIVNLGDLTLYTEHTCWMNVPYLFAENFSSLAQYDGDYQAGPYTSVSGASTAARDLAQYGIASGWTGARTGCNAAGTAILVAGRVDCVIAGATRAYGRLDSPELSCIKPNARVKVKVSFDYGGSRSGNTTYYPVGRVGYTTTSGLINGYATQFNNNAAFSDIDGAVEVPSIPTSDSASALTKSMTHTISDCTSSHRISWHVGHLGYKSWKINNGCGWMYIDNVRVQIVK